MACTIGLGQCHLHDTATQLDLKLTAKASLSQPGPPSSPPARSISQWPDPVTVWIKEAPTIEIRLSVRFSSALEESLPHFLFELEARLCNSQIWPELGFMASRKGKDIHRISRYPPEHCVILGLCRHDKSSSFERTRTLPAALQNPSEIPPPSGVSTMFLRAIEISLDFDCSFQGIQIPSEPFMGFGISTVSQSGTSIFTPHSDSAMDLEPGRWDPHDTSMEDSYFHWAVNDNDNLGSYFDLIDFGLQKLINSPAPKMPRIRIHGEDSLKNLRKLAPGIFNKEYREAMNQRAASIPVITGAVASMLKTTSNPVLQQHFPSLPGVQKEWITSSLWRNAQAQLPRPRAPKNGTRFFSPSVTTNSRLAIDTGHDNDTQSLNEILLSDEEILELVNDLDVEIDDEIEGIDDFPASMRIEGAEESDGLLLSDNTESSFQDLYESTQTTQTTLDSFPVDCEAVSSPHTEEMLLADSWLE